MEKNYLGVGKLSTQLGRPSKPNGTRRGSFVQTEQSAHEAWAKLILDSPKSAAMLHVLIARMDRGSNAVVISHENLALLLGGVSTRTVKNHIARLAKDKWIQVVSLGRGAMNAYVVNSAVAWGRSRDQLAMSQFTAQVIVNADDQQALEAPDLRKIPVIFGDEQQLPAGDGLAPPTQPSIDGLEPDLPAIQASTN